MGAYVSAFLRRVGAGTAVAITILCANTAYAQGEPAKPRSLEIAPSFEEDHSYSSVRYVWRGHGTAVSLSNGGTITMIVGTGAKAYIRFAGANARSEPSGEVRSAGRTIYYLGAAQGWRSASHFERVRYAGLYPGIDLVFNASGDRLEYAFEISP